MTKYENQWGWPDERFEGLLKIANGINDSLDTAYGNSGGPPKGR